MLIGVGLPAICVILPPAPSLLQEDSSDACVSIDALASAAERLRSNGLTGSNENGLAHSDAPDLIRQQGVQGKVWPITLKLFFALLAVAPRAWRLGSFSMRPGPCLLPKTKRRQSRLLRNTRRP